MKLNEKLCKHLHSHHEDNLRCTKEDCGTKDICCKENAIRLGQKIIPFKADALSADGKFIKWNIEDNYKAGKWTILFFYPKDFTFVCPTEIKAFSKLVPEFEKANAEVIGVSTDSTHVHNAWVNDSSLGKINLTLLSDTAHHISKYFGVYSYEEGISWRGTFIISPEGKLFVNYSTFGEVGRSAKEVLRLLEASQLADKGEMLPCEWKPGEDTL